MSKSRPSYKKDPTTTAGVRPSIDLPEKHRTAYVYTFGSEPEPNDREKIQGIWTKVHGHVMSDPQEVWIFNKGKEPPGLSGSKHVHGIWGYKPGVEPEQATAVERWFYTPGEEYPSYFTPRGVWTLPMVKKDISEIAPETMGFVDVGKGRVYNSMDVAGTWKMMYRRDGLPDAPIGPGMKGKKSKSAPPPPFMINVEHPNGNVLPLTEVTPTDTIMDVKHHIHTKTKMPPKDQNLYYDGQQLENTPTLTDLGIKSGDTIQLQPTIRFNVKKPDGSTVKLAMMPTDTIGDVKAKVEDATGIPANDQRLAYNGRPLSNNMDTLGDVGVNTGDTLDLMGMKVRIQTPDGGILQVDTDPEETIEQLKAKVEDMTNIPVKHQRYTYKDQPLDDNDDTLDEIGISHNDLIKMEPMAIRIRTPDGKIGRLQPVNPNETLDDIKKEIESRTSIPFKEQHLIYKGEEVGKVDDDANPTLEELGVEHNDIIDVSGMTIQLRTPEQTLIPIQVSKMDEIQDLKVKVKAKVGMPVTEQNLVFNGEVLDDMEDTLDECGIQHNDIVDLKGMTINVKTPDGRYIPISCRPTSTINEIKQNVESIEGVPIDDQRLVFGGKDLDKPQATLHDCGIKNRDVIDLGGMQLIVENSKGDTIKIDCKPTDTIDDIKDRVYDRKGILPEDQHLIYKGKELNDPDATLKECGLKHNDILDLEGMQVIIRNPEGKQMALNVKRNNTILDIKRKINKKSNLPIKEQHLVFDKNELSDPDTLEECGIKHRDILDLEPMRVRVRTEDATFPIDTYPTELISDLKKKISLKSGVPIDKQLLSFEDKNLEDDGDTLDDIGIQHNDVIDLGEGSPKINIIVNTPYGQSIPLEVDPTDTIKDVKKQVADKEGTPIKHQRLFYKGKQLDNSPTLEACGIVDGSTLDLGGMQISVKCPGGRILMLDVNPHDTISKVKKQVENREFIPVGIQNLWYKKQRLEDDASTLKENGIEHASILELTGQLLHVKVPSGEKLTLEVIPSWTIKDVKKDVCKHFKLEQLKHTIHRDGEEKELTLKPNLKYYKIDHDDVLEIKEIPTYNVEMSNWQSPFNYQSKPKIKREGIRAKKTPNITNQK